MVTVQLEPSIVTELVASADAEKFATHVVNLHQKLAFNKLVSSLNGDPIHVRQRHGYTIVAFQHTQAPRRYQIGVMGFRLAQYLRLGWASAQVVYNDRMLWESIDHASPNDLHIVALDDDSGSIIGYLGAAFVADEGDSRDLSAIDRPRFPVETAHNIDISDWLPPQRVGLSEIMEIKRFVKNPDIQSPMKFLVPLELVLGLMGFTVNRSTPIPWAVGDLEMHVALRHLKAFGVDTRVITGTQPSLPASDPMWPMYVRRSEVLPFIGKVQSRPQINRSFETIDEAFATGDMKTCLHGMLMAGNAATANNQDWEAQR